ncbi:PREDICTED: uncharacterized protein CG4449 [Dinoponera quadriceps]|uniref:Uncharacterized protein CG4449 n=1 Tax=Dinoponera quadriceps TaxID=609295 RepID=A0A6P3XVL7_DINQU|nr:PREDICTED: uncharacterized protein CG4449 [Dinoponera quadriceps]XP_014482136.1 PREDICTED: uncharacterized protein CG4449 [Dinoponera quadriceps]
MNQIVIDSSDEDDTYTSSVARLRALKRKRFEDEQLVKSTSIVVTNGKDDNITSTSCEVVPHVIPDDSIIEKKTAMTRSRTRKKGKSRDNGRYTKYPATTTRSTRRRPFINNLDCNVEFVSLEVNPNSVSKCNKNDTVTFSSNNTIALSSDDDANGEDDNYEITVKVLWRSIRLDRLSMRRHDSFLKIFQHYADLEKVSVNEVLIMRNDKIISFDDTPALLKLSVVDILDGGIVNPGMRPNTDKDANENDAYNIKVQTANKKQSLTFPLKKNEQFQALFSYCASHFGEKEGRLKFYFDGEQINPTDTPESLDIEGEACIDLQISSG